MSALIERRAIRIPFACSIMARRPPERALEALILPEALQRDVDRALQLLGRAVDDVGEDAARRRRADVGRIVGVQDRDHRTGGLADDLRDQLEGMRGTRPEPDQRDVRVLPGRDRPHFLDVDLTRDHVVTEPDHHPREQLEPVALLVRDQDAQVLELVAVGHVDASILVPTRPDGTIPGMLLFAASMP